MESSEMKLRLIQEIERLTPTKISVIYNQILQILRGNSSSDINVSETHLPDFIQPGTFSKDEKPSDFAGIWGKPTRNAKEIRVKAWQRNV